VSGEDPSALVAEQAGLRRVATLVARAAPPEAVFAAITEEVGQLLPVDFADMSRFDPDGAVTFVAAWGSTAAVFPVGSRWRPEGDNLCGIVARSGRPARIDSYARASGPIDAAVRDGGIRSSVGTPIVVEGRLWGVMAAGSSGEEPMPPDTEARLTQFTELLAMAVANAESRARLARLADEQAALRRVATLVAQDVASGELFGAVARELGTHLGADFSGLVRYNNDGATVTTMATWAADGEHPPVPDIWPIEPGDPTTMIAETRQATRVEDWSAVPGPIAQVVREQLGVTSSVGCPIMVEGRLWGAIAVHSRQPEPLPRDTEARAAQFAELVATAIANAEARAEVTRLAQEQAALRRVATLVAREASQAEVFTAIAEEIGQLLGTEEIRMMRYDADRSARVMARWGGPGDVMPVDSRMGVDGLTATAQVFRTERPVRIDDYADVPGPDANHVRSIGIRTVAAAPIHVEGRLWGAMVTATAQAASLPPDTEHRLGQFTELMATTIANTESHARAERLTDEQAALRRVATLVAKESSPADVFLKVAQEVADAVGDVDCALCRLEADGTITNVAAWGVGTLAAIRAGERLPAGCDGVLGRLVRAARPSRIDDDSTAAGGIRSAAASPIVVGERLWGVVAVARYDSAPLPSETEARVTRFTELVATAIANAEARAEVERLAAEQTALRRVATLVAEGASPAAVFDAVAAEMERLLDADQVVLSRYEPGGELVLLAHRGFKARRLPPGTRLRPQAESVSAKVRRTRRPTRMDRYDGAVARAADALDLRAAVGAPIVVDGGLWGVIVATWNGEEPPPADTEQRMARFAELLDTAVANADSRAQLTASRTRLLTAGDEARRRVVRDLHDGAQQRLVHAIVTLKLAQRALRQRDDGTAQSLVDEALEQAQRGNVELRDLAHGILPAVLTRGGLRAGVDAIVARLAVPVEVLRLPDVRFPAEIEASAYFIVAEALTNVVKHAHADRAEVDVSATAGVLHVAVADDGIGGADPTGHGLVAMADRVTALGGRLEIDSPAGGGTRLAATLPVEGLV
jgi:GAF domain-containing protein